jgi:1-acyl-sn-glycerol-3-phosphate acyltransferase
MLYFIASYIWSWVVVPICFCIMRPFVRLDYQTNAYHFLYTILGIKHKISGEPLIDKGFILSNHRCFLDAIIDAYVANSTTVSRGLTIVVAPFIQLLAYIDNRTIVINRSKDNRQNVYTRCISHINQHPNKRICFYPEGTRNKYLSLKSRDELKSYIKFGLLKSIYEDKQFPVQLMISNNKELAFNEKRFSANYGVSIHTTISRAIHPKDFASDVLFFDEIIDVWFELYNKTHM